MATGKLLTAINNYDLYLVTLEELKADDDLQKDIISLLETSYYNTKMPEHFKDGMKNNKKNYYFNLYNEKGELIATRHMYYKNSEWGWYEDIVKFLNIEEAVKAYALVVKEDYRGNGLASKMIKYANKYIFDNINVYYILGDTWHCGAMRLYMELGVDFYQSDIDNMCHLLPPEKNRIFFKKFLSDKEWTEWKLRDCIRYWYKNPNK